MLNFKQRLNKITTLIFDIDGVLTDGKVLVFENGEMIRNMNSKDGYALHLAVNKKYRNNNNNPVVYYYYNHAWHRELISRHTIDFWYYKIINILQLRNAI